MIRSWERRNHAAFKHPTKTIKTIKTIKNSVTFCGFYFRIKRNSWYSIYSAVQLKKYLPSLIEKDYFFDIKPFLQDNRVFFDRGIDQVMGDTCKQLQQLHTSLNQWKPLVMWLIYKYKQLRYPSCSTKKAIDAYQCLLVNGRRLHGYDYVGRKFSDIGSIFRLSRRIVGEYDNMLLAYFPYAL
jgi:hypothetical protein